MGINSLLCRSIFFTRRFLPGGGGISLLPLLPSLALISSIQDVETFSAVTTGSICAIVALVSLPGGLALASGLLLKLFITLPGCLLLSSGPLLSGLLLAGDSLPGFLMKSLKLLHEMPVTLRI